jgi:hypothetical protein
MNGSELPSGAAYELRFDPLVPVDRAYVFPCDAQGHVDMDALSERVRADYLYARAMIGRETAAPRVRSTRTAARDVPGWRALAAIGAARRLLSGARVACC